METKSRYEVILDLETKKRELINERESFTEKIIEKEKEIKFIERQKYDNEFILDRQIEDKKEGLEKFKKSIDEKKDTIKELIVSIDESLGRFQVVNKTK